MFRGDHDFGNTKTKLTVPKMTDKELGERIAEQIYEFVHRGRTHMPWKELPYKWGKRAYYELAIRILALIKEASGIDLGKCVMPGEFETADAVAGWRKVVEVKEN